MVSDDKNCYFGSPESLDCRVANYFAIYVNIKLHHEFQSLHLEATIMKSKNISFTLKLRWEELIGECGYSSEKRMLYFLELA